MSLGYNGGGIMRDYKKEAQWKKQKYDEIRAHIDINLGKKLREKLKENGETIAGWVTERAKEEINN